MSRVSYSEEESFPGQFELFHANLRRSVYGKRGQAALRDLEAALLSMPEKRLIAGHLAKDGEVCANGALVAYRRMQREKKAREEVLSAMEIESSPACGVCWCRRSNHPEDGGPCTSCAGRIESDRAWDAKYLSTHPESYQWRPYGPSKMRDFICHEYSDKDPLSDYEYDEEDEEGIVEDAAVAVGVPRLVAWALVEQNDDLFGYAKDVTPEQRYETLLKWTQKRIKRDEATPAY
jgi:hypothetical protein